MFKNAKRLLYIATIIITLFGLLMIYSSSSIWAEYKYNDSLFFVKHQLLFIVIGFILIIIINKIPFNKIAKYINLLLLISIVLLILVLIPGIGQIRNGSRSWFGIGGFGIQPSELAKLALILFVSKYTSVNYKLMNNTIKGVFPILAIILIVILLIMLEPDFGSAFVIFLSVISIILISNVKLSLFLKLGIVGLIGMVILIVIAPYRLMRILSFLNPWQDPLGSGFQIIQSLYAIGPDGLLGKGLFNSIQKNFYLPEPQTDFIFAIISEEFGFLGVFIVVILFIIILYSSIKISLGSNNLLAKNISFGLSISIFIQAILNLSVVIGLVPVTGVTLPFLSYGGSSLLVSMASIGIIINISKNNS